MKHTLDSNILIGLIQRYPRDIFPNIWHNIEKLAENNAVCICSAVHYETSQADDVLYDWAKKLPRFVCPPTNEEFQIAKQIGEDHPGWVQGDHNGADPFIIAHAKVEGSIIVTEERRKGPNTQNHNLRIPNVADEYQVKTIDFFAFIRHQGWSF